MVVTSRGRSHIAIVICIHAHDHHCKIAITEGNAPPVRTPCNSRQISALPRPFHLPNRSIGRLEGAAHHSTRRYTQNLHFCSPSTIWAQFSRLQQFSRDESVVLHSLTSFPLLFTSPRLTQPTIANSTRKSCCTVIQVAPFAGTFKWQNSQHILSIEHEQSTPSLLPWHMCSQTTENTTLLVISVPISADVCHATFARACIYLLLYNSIHFALAPNGALQHVQTLHRGCPSSPIVSLVAWPSFEVIFAGSFSPSLQLHRWVANWSSNSPT